MDLNHIYFQAHESPALPIQPVELNNTASGVWRSSAGLAIIAKAGARPEPELADPFFDWLFRRGGLSVESYRGTALRRRLPACLRRLRVASVENARNLLETSPGLISAALDSVLIGVSEFFRDPAVFKQMEGQVLPGLLKERPCLRILSAGVAAGQELYSVAMLLDQLRALQACELVGLDCRPEAIRRAAAGVYSPGELGGLGDSWRDHYFEFTGGQWIISPHLREQPCWRLADLRQLPEERWDVILFRNVAIYMKETAGTALWRHFVSQLRPGGVLVTGKSEHPPPHLPLERVGLCIYQRRG